MSIRWRINADGITKTAYLDITISGCERLRESTGITSDQPGAKQCAREYHDKRQRDIWRQAKIGERPRRVWEEAVVKWLAEHSHKKSLRDDHSRLRWLDQHCRGVYLDTMDREFIDAVLDAKAADGVSGATVNRHAALLRSVLRSAWCDWGWIDMPARVRMRQETEGCVVWMTREETDMLLEELHQTARHQEDAVLFTLNTGLREQNVCQLRWDQINMEKQAMYIYKTKNGRSLGTPLNADAMEILHSRAGLNAEFVFTWRGKNLSRFNNTAWRNALQRTLERIKKANGGHLPERLEHFNWHSLRHTWATWMAQADCPMETLQKLGGWRNMAMVMRYAHFSTGHLARYAQLTARKRPNLKAVI